MSEQQNIKDIIKTFWNSNSDTGFEISIINKNNGENLNSIISSGKYTPASIAKYKVSKNPEDLELAELVVQEARLKYHKEFSNHGE